ADERFDLDCRAVWVLLLWIRLSNRIPECGLRNAGGVDCDCWPTDPDDTFSHETRPVILTAGTRRGFQCPVASGRLTTMCRRRPSFQPIEGPRIEDFFCFVESWRSGTCEKGMKPVRDPIYRRAICGILRFQSDAGFLIREQPLPGHVRRADERP